MFGPFSSSTSRACSGDGGTTIWPSSSSGLGAGASSAGGSPSARGSVIVPANAVAAAVAGEQR